ncbi:hypothetical protein Tco_1313757 [Tanacetum coccineum]
MRVNIPEFDRNTLNPEGFINWPIAVEEVFEFKDVPKNKRVSLIATKLHGRASAWWQQLKLTKERVGKPSVTSWRKIKKLVRKTITPRILGWYYDDDDDGGVIVDVGVVVLAAVGQQPERRGELGEKESGSSKIHTWGTPMAYSPEKPRRKLFRRRRLQRPPVGEW